MEDSDLYHLIVNPYKVNRDKKKINRICTIDDKLLCLLKEKYPKFEFEGEDYNIIINKLDILIFDLSIKKLIDNLIYNVVEGTLDDLINV